MHEITDLCNSVELVALHVAATVFLGDHPKAAIDDRVKSGHREKA